MNWKQDSTQLKFLFNGPSSGQEDIYNLAKILDEGKIGIIEDNIKVFYGLDSEV